MSEPKIGKKTFSELWLLACKLWMIVAVGATVMVSPLFAAWSDRSRLIWVTHLGQVSRRHFSRDFGQNKREVWR